MTLRRLPAFTMIAIVGLAVQAEARAPCQEYLRLRNAATEAWQQAMRAPQSERCGALYHASLAAEATLKYADNNRESCGISVRLLNQVEGYHREAIQARDNACAGRPLRPYPADSSNVEIVGSLVQCSLISAIDVRVGARAAETVGPAASACPQRPESGLLFGQPDDSATPPTEAAYLRITFRAARPARNSVRTGRGHSATRSQCKVQ